MSPRKDYRVDVVVTFSVDVGAETVGEAFRFVEMMTEQVFKADYARAESVVVEAVHAKPLESSLAAKE